MENIKVFLRLRPPTDKDRSTNPPVTVRIASEQELIVQSNHVTNAPESKFEFDKIFNKNAQQTDVYNTVAVPIVTDVVGGYNCTLYSYGAHGTGQYYTMIGSSDIFLREISNNIVSPKALLIKDPSDAGLIPLTILSLFKYLNIKATRFNVRISYLEIFNDEIIDLLQDSDTNCPNSTIKIFENVKNQVILNGLKEVSCVNYSAALDVLRIGQEQLKNRLHSVNSHKIFTINVQLKEKPRNGDEDNDLLKFSRLNFVQLSSAENSNSKGRAKSVQSLASFNRVVQALIDKQSHIPYRDSKLTRILQESLGGNTKTSIIATISPESASIEESLKTLDLMNRIKCVVNQPRINERLNKNVSLNYVSYEIVQLKRDIEATKNQDGIQISIDAYEEQCNLLYQTRLDIRRNRFEMQSLSEKLEHLENNYANADANLNILSRKIALLQKMKEIQNNNLKAINIVNQQRDEYIAKQVATEKNLAQQSNQLVETINLQREDASKLHDSLDRRKVVDADLENTLTRFRSDLDSHLKNLSTYMINNNKIFQNMIAVHKTNLEKFHNMTISMLELFKSGSMQMDQKAHVSLQNGQENIDVIFTEILDDFTDRTLVSNGFTPPAMSPFEEFVSICEIQFAMSGKTRNTFLQMIENRRQMTDQLIENLKESIESFANELKQKFSQYRMTLEKHVEEKEKYLQKFTESYELYQKKIHQILENNEKLKSMNPFSEETEEIVQNSTKNCLQLIFNFKSHAHALNEKHLNIGQQCSVKDCGSTMVNILKLAKENANQKAITQEAIGANDNVAMKTAFDQMVEMESSILEKVQFFSKNELTSKVMDNLAKGDTHNSNEYIENNNLIQNMLMAQKQLSKDVSNGFEACTRDVKYFCDINFCQYPSGDTPVKKNYKTSVTLAAKTPHDELKRKFREIFDQLDDDELDADISFLGRK